MSPLRSIGRYAAGATALLGALAVPVGGPSLAAAAPVRCATSKTVYQGNAPWPQHRWDLQRIWPLSTGRGVTVAVLATGVDARHYQFDRHQVMTGADVRSGSSGGSADRDCDGRGTFAAGLIAARPRENTTFVGMAPDAKILPVRYTSTRDGGGSDGNSRSLVRAIQYGGNQSADVIVIPTAEKTDTRALREAVTQAVAADAVVVAAGRRDDPGPTYPTIYRDVLAVTAISRQGTLTDEAERGGHIDLAAPGDGLVSSVGTRGHVGPVSSPGMAAAFVAGTVALVRAYRPDLSAREVILRLLRTADPPAQRPEPNVNWGVVNPYLAVTSESLSPATGTVPVDRRSIQPASPPHTDRSPRVHRALLMTGLTGMGAALLVIGIIAVRRNRITEVPT